jgi:hypothetical protein
MRGRGIWIGYDLELVWLQDSSQRVVEESGILRGPEVYVEGVQPVHVLGLVGGVMRREVPLGGVLLGTLCRTGALAAEAIDSQGEEAGMLVRVLYSDRLKLYTTNNVSSLLQTPWLGKHTASKGILVWCARVVCNFNATRLPYGVMVEVDIGAFVEAVVRGLLGRRGNVVVDVCKAATMSVLFLKLGAVREDQQGQQGHLALLRRHCVDISARAVGCLPGFRKTRRLPRCGDGSQECGGQTTSRDTKWVEYIARLLRQTGLLLRHLLIVSPRSARGRWAQM